MLCDDDGVVVNPHAVFVRSAYNYDKDAASEETALRCEDPTRAKQEFKDECDINVIVERFGLTGEMPQDVRMPFNADFDGILSYQEALNQLIAADEAFYAFPAEIRDRFQNNPARFVDFVSDPKNIAQAHEWGLTRADFKLPEEGPPPGEKTA